MKNEKLNLKELKVSSFITDIDNKDIGALKGALEDGKGSDIMVIGHTHKNHCNSMLTLLTCDTSERGC